MSTAVKYKKRAFISLIVLSYTAKGIVLACTQRTGTPFKIQICELELFLSSTYLLLPTQVKLANRRTLIHRLSESFIFSVSGAQHAEAHCTHSKSIKESRDSVVMIALYDNFALKSTK